MRTGRVRTLGLGLALLVGAIAPVLASPLIACAAATSGEHHAGLVIDTRTRTTTYCVALDDVSVSGTHLIELASAQFGLNYRLGFGGRAICMLDGVGVVGDDCFGAYPDFWGYFHGNGGNGWTWASGSAADHAVGDGDLEGWVWGSGDSATTHGSPPDMTIGNVCAVAPSPSPDPSPTPAPSPSGSPSASPSGGQAGGDDSGNTSVSRPPDPPAAGSASTSPAHRPGSPTPFPAAAAPTSASPDVVRAAAAAPPTAGGPPAGGVLVLGAIALLGAGGWLKLRRRKGAP